MTERDGKNSMGTIRRGRAAITTYAAIAIGAALAISAATVPAAFAQPKSGETSAARAAYKKASADYKVAKTIDEYTKIIDDCKKGLEEQPTKGEERLLTIMKARALNRRGLLYSKEGKADQALADYDEAISTCPTDYASRYLFLNSRAIHMAEAGEYEKALDDFNAALKQNPKSVKSHFNRGELLYSLGKYDEAIEAYTNALRYNSRDALTYNARGHAQYKKNAYALAMSDYNRAIQLDSNLAEAYLNRADAHADRGNFASAMNDYRNGLRLNPKSPLGLRSAAWLMATCPTATYRDPKRAISAAEEALKLNGDPDDPRFLDTLAAAYANAGQYEKAEETQGRAVELATEAKASLDELKMYRDRLVLYKKNQPYRDQLKSEGRTKTPSRKKPRPRR